MQEQHLVKDARDLVEVVQRDESDRLAVGGQAADEREQRQAVADVQGAGRLAGALSVFALRWRARARISTRWHSPLERR